MKRDNKSILIIYDCQNDRFIHTDESSNHFVTGIEKHYRERLRALAAAEEPQVHFTECTLRDRDLAQKKYRIGFVCSEPGKQISITITELEQEEADCHKAHVSYYDELTGLLTKSAFIRKVEETILHNGRAVDAGEYALIYCDIIRFKAINDMFGMAEGDHLLRYIADVLRKTEEKDTLIGRLEADRFLIFTHHVGETLEKGLEKVLEALAEYKLPFKITCNIGIYVTNEELLSVEGMIDRAVLAQSSIKGSYTSSYKYYTESMRKDMLGEQEIAGIMGNALEEKQFVLYYQPQYNHANGMLIGAEALVRWIHPERGMISPGVFIPIFEKNGFITKLDLYVFERVCEFVRRCIDTGLPIVPVSSNFSRYDIFQPDFVAKLETIRKKYDVPTKYLRIEITESVVVGGSQHTNEIIRSLHECGYIVEMDDFGSGYSSLNVLKDIELDIIKLDMMFLSEDSDSKKGGTILSSMVRMAKWLGMPVIAEGVEHLEQADFLKSIGCEYIQGYLYSRPLPEEQYIELLSESVVGTKLPQMELNEKLNAFNFWDPKSQETLIFSNYVGGAAIFEYQAGKVELLRVNEKYLQELGMCFSEKEVIGADPMKYFDDSNKKIFIDMLDKAIETGEEEECETWRNDPAIGCPEDGICIHSNVRMVGKSNGSYLFYAMIRNITKEKRQYEELMQMLRQTEKMD